MITHKHHINENSYKRVIDRITAIKDDGGKHWVWNGGCNNFGHPEAKVVNEDGSSVVAYVHRLVWIYEHGSIEPRDKLVRTCDMNKCVKPAHFKLVKPKNRTASSKRNDADNSELKERIQYLESRIVKLKAKLKDKKKELQEEKDKRIPDDE